jgi:hypothetical protein
MNKVYLFECEDWCGLYINGRLDMENHSLDVGRVIERLSTLGSFSYEGGYVDGAAWEFAERWGSCPEDLTVLQEWLLNLYV